MTVLFHLTAHGKKTAVNAEQKNIHVDIQSVMLGTGRYNAQQEAQTMTKLKNPVMTVNFDYAYRHENGTLQLHSYLQAQRTQDIYELGIMMKDGTLFAVASSTDKPLFTLIQDNDNLFMLGVKLADADESRINVIVDNQTGLALRALELISKIQDIPIGGIFLTHIPFENATQVAKFKKYGKWRRFGNGQILNTVQHTGTPAHPFLSKMEAVGGDYWNLDESVKDVSHITVGAWVRIPESKNYLDISTDKTSLAVGQTATITVYTDLPEFIPLDYRITGVQSNKISYKDLTGVMLVGENGVATTQITASEDYNADGNQTLTFSVDNKSVRIEIVDTGENTPPQHIKKAGTHTITIEPNQTLTIDMYGGGGSKWSTQYGQNFDGKHGADVQFTLAQSTITVGGGRAGTQGEWGNGSSYTNGVAGAGGTNSVDNKNGLEILVNQQGNSAVSNQNRYGTQQGADVLAGAIDGSNFGGNGGNGLGDERWSYGGAGGSGGRVKARFTNTTNGSITAKLVVGETLIAPKNGEQGQQDGGFAYASYSIT